MLGFIGLFHCTQLQGTFFDFVSEHTGGTVGVGMTVLPGLLATGLHTTPSVNSLRNPRLSSLHPTGPTNVLDRGEWAGAEEDTGQSLPGLDGQVPAT